MIIDLISPTSENITEDISIEKFFRAIDSPDIIIEFNEEKITDLKYSNILSIVTYGSYWTKRRSLKKNT